MNIRLLIRFACVACLAFLCHTASAQSSVLSSGNWYKISVDKRGVFMIDNDMLRAMGIDAGSVNPKRIKLYGYGGGMLPQQNAVPRVEDLSEIGIQVTGEEDGKFDSQDRILFYGEGPDDIDYDASRDIYRYEHNLFSDRNFYFLTIGESDGKRLGTSTDLNTAATPINTYRDFSFHETDTYSELQSGREWFGERFELTTDQTFSFEAPGMVNSSPIRVVSDVMAQSYLGSSFKLYFDGSLIGEQFVESIFNSRYSEKGMHQRDTLSFSYGGTSTTTAHQLRYQYIKSSGRSNGFLDFFLVNFTRSLAWYGGQTFFISPESTQQATAEYKVAQVPQPGVIWDITVPSSPAQQLFRYASGVASFTTETGTLKKYVVLDNNFPKPEFIGKVLNQNLHGMSTPQLIIISHPDFLVQANRLAAHRQTYSNITAVVVTPEQIYNEFSSGRQDVTAMRDFIRHLYEQSPSTLRSALFFGRGSYDYKNRVANNTNFVPTYESRNSLHPLQTYSSDDYFGFLESNEGEWSEDPAINHTLDIGVGRIPVKTLAEATTVVDKLIEYDTEKKNFGRWRKEITFVADDGNTDDGFNAVHQDQANDMAVYIENNQPGFDTRKIFMGTYAKEIKPSGETSTAMSAKIVEAFDRGSLIINFTGHGSERVWTDERVFTDFIIPTLKNETYPFLVTATCEFGRQDDPSQISSAEMTLTQKDGGAIGLVTTARPVNSSTNFQLNSAFYEAFFEKENGRYSSIGEIFRHTKNNSTSGISNRNFSLIGDPSMTLAMPVQKVVITEMSTASGSETLKALSHVTVKGEVQDNDGNLITSFDGTLDATLFDKETSFITTGKNNPAFQFKQWYNALFRGKARVDDGAFEFNFIVPKNIAYEAGQGKLSLYASDLRHASDASGATIDFNIGGTEVNAPADNTAPQIALFMGDTTFVNGGGVTPDTHIVALLKDASGINISGYGIGNDVIAVLDDSQTFILNDYYVANANDFTGGSIRYPLKGLAPGKHTINLKVWDTYNNPAEATVDFVVTDGQALMIESFGNYPNPVRESTTLFFTHNRSGDDLQATLYIYSITGQIIKAVDFTVSESSYRVDLVELRTDSDFEKKPEPGLYLARIVVRSLSNSSKNERVTKLIIVN